MCLGGAQVGFLQAWLPIGRSEGLPSTAFFPEQGEGGTAAGLASPEGEGAHGVGAALTDPRRRLMVED